MKEKVHYVLFWHLMSARFGSTYTKIGTLNEEDNIILSVFHLLSN